MEWTKKPDWVGTIERYRPVKVLWKEQRLIAVKRDGYKCKWCKSKEKLVVHHTSYRHEKGTKEELRCLITLCANCHNKFHDTHHYDRAIGSHRKGKRGTVNRRHRR